MAAWFSRTPKPTVEARLSELAACGIRLRSDAMFAAIRENAEYDMNHDYESLLAVMGDASFDPQTYEPLEPYSDDVWHFDYEAIEDHGAYKSIVENCLRLSGGALRYDQVLDYVDIERGIAWVELHSNGQADRIDLRVKHDWADPKIFRELNNRLRSIGAARRYFQHDLGQDCLLVCKTPEDVSAINRVTGLRFGLNFG